SVASVLVQEPRSKISSGTKTNPMVPQTADETYVLSEAEALRSAELVSEVLKVLPEQVKEELWINLDPLEQVKTGLKRVTINLLTNLKLFTPSDKNEETKAPRSGQEDVDKEQIAALLGRMIIKSKSKNAMIWITATSTNKYAAPIIVKSYISVWMARNLAENKRAIRTEKAFAMEQRDTARKHMNEAAQRLADFRTRYEIPPYITPKEGLGDLALQSEFERLSGQLKAATERFEYLDQVFLKLQMEESGIAENIKLLDPPTSPGAPAETARDEILLAGILGGLALGIAVVLGLDFVKNPIRHEKDILSAVNIPIFGQIPRV
ncbi:MAG: hypothetical protein ABIN58_06410, partial [candidate division WOR-3 bacterium]